MCLVRFFCDNLAHTSFGKNQVSKDLAELGCFFESSFVLLLAFVALLVLHLHWWQPMYYAEQEGTFAK